MNNQIGKNPPKMPTGWKPQVSPPPPQKSNIRDMLDILKEAQKLILSNICTKCLGSGYQIFLGIFIVKCSRCRGTKVDPHIR